MDMTRCINSKCPAKKHCRRYTTRSKLERGEAYFKPSPKGMDCKYFSPPKAMLNENGKWYIPGTKEEIEERRKYGCRQVECDSVERSMYTAECQTCFLYHSDCYKAIVYIAYDNKVFGRLQAYLREQGYNGHWRPWMFMYEKKGILYFKHRDSREYLKVPKR